MIGALKEFGVKLQNQPPPPYSRRSNILRANVIRNAASLLLSFSNGNSNEGQKGGRTPVTMFCLCVRQLDGDGA